MRPYTFGPWLRSYLADGTVAIKSGEKCTVAHVKKGAAHFEENARLIAASPEIATALDIIRVAVRNVKPGHEKDLLLWIENTAEGALFKLNRENHE